MGVWRCGRARQGLDLAAAPQARAHLLVLWVGKGALGMCICDSPGPLPHRTQSYMAGTRA